MYYYNGDDFHVFEKNHKFFLYRIHNLAILELNEVAYDILSLNYPVQRASVIESLSGKHHRANIEEALVGLLEWQILSKTRLRSTQDPDIKNPYTFGVNDIFPMTSFYLFVSQDCNLRCKYCSAGYGLFGKEWNVKKMSTGTAKQAVDFFLSHQRPMNQIPNIIFAGGEPLLNMEVIKFTVEYFRSKSAQQASFLLNTNGTLMTEEKARWFAENQVSVRFSIDGTREIHDANRVYTNGDGSYDDVMQGLIQYRKYEKGNLTVQAAIPNGRDLVNAVKSLWDLGAEFVVDNIAAESPHLESKSYILQPQEEAELLSQWEELNQGSLENFIHSERCLFSHFTYQFLHTLHQRTRRPTHCGVAWNPSITPDGSIYACAGFVGFDDFKIGDIFIGINTDSVHKMGEIFVRYLSKCNHCWARHACRLACFAQSFGYKELGAEFEATRMCRIFRAMVESTICDYAYLSKNCKKESLDRYFPKATHNAPA
jgi:uncharacterized protein